jgi:hypothetical protein
MATWGSQRVSSVTVPHSVVLLALEAVLLSKQEIVAYEVLLAVRRFVSRYGDTLLVEWDIVFRVMKMLRRYAAIGHSNTNFVSVLQEALQEIQELSESRKYLGNERNLLFFLDEFAKFRSESRALAFLTSRFARVSTHHVDWSQDLQALSHLYYRRETRSVVRVRFIELLLELCTRNRHTMVGFIASDILLPFFGQLWAEKDIRVQTRSVELLVAVAGLLQVQHHDLFERILELVSTRPNGVPDESALSAVRLLCTLFRAKFASEATVLTVSIFNCLVHEFSGSSHAVRELVTKTLGLLKADKVCFTFQTNRQALSLSLGRRSVFASSCLRQVSREREHWPAFNHIAIHLDGAVSATRAEHLNLLACGRLLFSILAQSLHSLRCESG